MKLNIIHDEAATLQLKKKIDDLYLEMTCKAKKKNKWLVAGCFLLYPVLCAADFFLWKTIGDWMLSIEGCPLWLPVPWTVFCWLMLPLYLVHYCYKFYLTFKDNGPSPLEELYTPSIKYMSAIQGKNLINVQVEGTQVIFYLEDPNTHIVTAHSINGFTVQLRTNITETTVNINDLQIETPYNCPGCIRRREGGYTSGEKASAITQK